jgi:hypothetical protein
MRIGKPNRSTQRKPAPVPLCPPQIPQDLTWARTWAYAVGSWRLTTWAMTWPHENNIYIYIFTIIKNILLWDIMPCSLKDLTNIWKEADASIVRVLFTFLSWTRRQQISLKSW